MRNTVLICGLLMSAILLPLAGCSDDILDPTQIGRFRPVPVVNVILDSLGVADEPISRYDGADDPQPMDIVAYEQDYVFGSGDVILVSIYELKQDFVMYEQSVIVTETGRISIPDVGQVTAKGLTEKELEDELKLILSPSHLKDPSVTVVLLNSESRMFSILGNAVNRPGRYSIPRYNFRLTDALAVGGDVSQFNADYIYVSRAITGSEPLETTGYSPEPAIETTIDTENIELEEVDAIKTDQGKGGLDPEDELLDVIAPYARGDNVMPVITSADMPTVQNAQIEWIFEDGTWKPVRTGQQDTADQPTVQKQQMEFETVAPEPREGLDYGWDEVASGGQQTRVIKIPIDKLMGGDPKYNIIIRPGDSISVPLNVVGEFCIMGNVNSSAYIPLTGRPMTLMQAVAAAGGLNPLAWPRKVEVKRRVGRNKAGLMQDLTVMVDLKRISQGLQPDFFIKPDDTINVGTHGTSRWLAVLRNAFRATYGFGFVYDRNFATRDFKNKPFDDITWPF